MGRSSLKNVIKLIDIANDNLPVDKQFLNDLQVSIEKSNISETIPSKTIKPSSFNCVRNAYFQLIGEKPEPSMNTYQLFGICDSGTDRHIRIQKAIEKMNSYSGMDCEYIDVADFIKQRNLTDLVVKGKSGMETKLYNTKYNMSFMTDGIIRYKGKYYIFEFKTETFDKFYNRKDVDESHKVQAICYSLNFGIDDVIFLYENRNDCTLKSFMYKVTDEMKQDIIGKITLCEDAVSKLRPPAKPKDVLKKTCNYCAYRSKCEEYQY